MVSKKCVILAVLVYITPLTAIAIAAGLSGWFDLLRNALSDLGHATRSSVAPIFNLGLYMGSFLLALFALKYSANCSKLITYLLLLSAFCLGLVAVFDEVYGLLHFWVSVAFFISVAALLIGYSIEFHSYVYPVAALAAGVASWITHLAYRVPRGAAVPELISIFLTLPLYLRYVTLVCRNCCK
ncbi:MAG: DUF998 domain-containing protein [Sulfolobales archaeon]|nr:DUF998 domain-containing protein [Sulfolobales archaeon]MDW8082953.1 DUF998 domain-containing protein [Sulfolobales archaeon]